MSEVEALAKYMPAPLPARRDMAMQSLLHKVCNSIAPGPLAALFPSGRVRESTVPTRIAEFRHGRQLAEVTEAHDVNAF